MFSKDLFQESKKFIPGGVSSPVRAFEPYPFFVKKASGSKVYDVDGNKYIDHCLAYGPTENEIILAKEVVDRIPSAEMVRFVNSGGEATMSAIRLARGFTGKDKIIKFDGAYHGAHDYTLVKGEPGKSCLYLSMMKKL